MDKTIKQVLKLIEQAGFEAYVVGGYVRDFILKIKSTDIDICTNALQKNLQEIFYEYNTKSEDYGSFKILSDKYTFDITTYRIETNYSNRKPTQVEYVDNLLTDLNRRDITINTLCMNSKGIIIDLLNGLVDINTKTIRMIGDPDLRLKEDPLRILRVIRFASSLGFIIEDSLKQAIINNSHLVESLSVTRKKSELEKILIGQKRIEGLRLIKQFGLEISLSIRYNEIINSNDLCGMYSQIEFDSSYQFTKEEKRNIEGIKKILSYGKIDYDILFEYGLYLSTVAGEMLGFKRKNIALLFKQLPITSLSDINISPQEIISILEVKPSSIIKVIQNDLKTAILKGELNNNREDICNYLIHNKGKWDNA